MAILWAYNSPNSVQVEVACTHNHIWKICQILRYDIHAISTKCQMESLVGSQFPLHLYIVFSYQALDLELVWLSYSRKYLICALLNPPPTDHHPYIDILHAPHAQSPSTKWVQYFLLVKGLIAPIYWYILRSNRLVDHVIIPQIFRVVLNTRPPVIFRRKHYTSAKHSQNLSLFGW